MKIKYDFVTNSSSASFTIPLKELNEIQIMAIFNHIEIGAMFVSLHEHIHFYLDPWKIEIVNNELIGDTSMDNFDMLKFLELIGVKKEVITYDHD